MTMKHTKSTFPILVLLAACSSEGGSVGLSVHAVTSDGSSPATELVMTDDGAGDFQIEAATLRLRHIELDLLDGGDCADLADSVDGAICEDGVDGNKISIEGPFEIDLVAGTSTPSLAEVQIPAGTYKRIDFRVEDNGNDSSFAVRAGFDHEGAAMTLDLNLDFNEDIRIEDAQGLVVDADSDLIAEFVVNNWLGGVDVGACIDDEDVTVVGSTVTIDDSSTSGSCSDIENTIKDNMKNSGQLDKD